MFLTREYFKSITLNPTNAYCKAALFLVPIVMFTVTSFVTVEFLLKNYDNIIFLIIMLCEVFFVAKKSAV